MEIATRTSTVLLNRESVILLPKNGVLEIKLASQGFNVDENELAVAEWAYEHSRPAGRGTDTLPAASIRFVPLLTANGPVGVIGIKPSPNEGLLTNDQRLQLEGLANLTALAVERAMLAHSAAQSSPRPQTARSPHIRPAHP